MVDEGVEALKARLPPSKVDVRASLRALSATAVDRDKAAASDAAMGLDKPERTRRKAPVTVVRGASEAQVLNAVLALLRRHPAVAWAHRMNTGAATFGEQFVRFGFLGCSDILGQMKDGRLLAVECKAESGGKLSDAQRDFLLLVRKYGGVAGVVRSAVEAALLVKYALTAAPARE